MATEQEWRKRFEHRERSGLSIAEWCKRHGVKANRYYYWHEQICGKGAVVKEGEFVRIVSTESLELQIGEKLRLKIPANFDGAAVKRLLEVLGC